MKINNFKLNDLIQNLPAIQVELEYEDGEGSAEISELEVIADKYILFLDFNILEVLSYDKGDRLTPPSTESIEVIIEDISFVLTYTDTETEISLTKLQKQELTNTIKSLIQTTF